MVSPYRPCAEPSPDWREPGTRAWAGTGARADTVQLRLRLTPKSSRDAVIGLAQAPDGPAIKATVRAVPQDGAANTAVLMLVAKWLRMPKSSITLSAGTKSRTRILTIVADKPDRARLIEQIDQHSTN